MRLLQEASMRVDVLHRRVSEDVREMQDTVNSVLPAKLPTHYETREMNIRSFVKKLNAVCEPFGIFNEIVEKSPDVEEGKIITSGLWIPKADLPENGSHADIRILWHVHPKTRRFRMTNYHWNRRRFYFWQTLMHELIHRHQGDRGARVYRTQSEDRRVKETQKYYGSTDEIETHAHDAALELVTWWPHMSLKQSCAEARRISAPTDPTVVSYEEAFAECPSHPAIKHFRRKLKSWYDVLCRESEFYDSLQLTKIV